MSIASCPRDPDTMRNELSSCPHDPDTLLNKVASCPRETGTMRSAGLCRHSPEGAAIGTPDGIGCPKLGVPSGFHVNGCMRVVRPAKPGGLSSRQSLAW